jgi:hypothetical protein
MVGVEDQTARSMRMPKDVEEGRTVTVYDQWDRLNGRYYIKAEVRLEDGCVTAVAYSTETYIAVEVNRRPIYEQPSFFGQRVVAFVGTRNRSPGRNLHTAPDDRALFERNG